MKRSRLRWQFLPLALGAVLMLFPLWWMLVVSLETASRAGAATVDASALAVWPEDPQWSNYPDALAEVGTERWDGFLDAFANSVVVTVLTVIATVLSCSLVAYALARIRFIQLLLDLSNHARGRGWTPVC